MATAILCYSSPAAVPGTTSLGFSRFVGVAVTKPSLGGVPIASKRLLRIHCQQQEQQQQNTVVIPREQRWMFEESEINGPVNAEKVAVSGKKRSQKLYRRHSGRPGGMKVETFAQLQERIPERIIEHAVRGMLPKGRLGRRLFTHLKVYKGPDHPHEAQLPIPLPIRDKRIQIDK